MGSRYIFINYLCIYLFVYLFAWNPHDPSVGWKGHCFGGFKLQNRGQKGCRCIYAQIHIRIYVYNYTVYIRYIYRSSLSWHWQILYVRLRFPPTTKRYYWPDDDDDDHDDHDDDDDDDDDDYDDDDQNDDIASVF